MRISMRRNMPLSGGYITLLSALVLSALLASAGVTLAATLVLAQDSIGAIQATEQARSLARGCAQIMQRAIAETSSIRYAGQLVLVAGVGTCSVQADVDTGEGWRKVQMQAVVFPAALDLYILLDPHTHQIRAQSESP